MILFVKGTRSYAIFLWIDRHIAGLIGMRYGDKYSVSAQCWQSKCIFCKWLGALLDLIQPDHFKIAAQLEGLDESGPG